MEIIGKVEDGPVIIQPTVFEDNRGYFFESFNDNKFKDKVAYANFVQDNESKSSYGVLRGMHYQTGDSAQAKLVRVVSGEAIDVAIDCRPDKPTFGKVYYAILSQENHRQFFIPRGFAHGFLTLRDNTIFQYKCDNFYNQEAEGGFAWNSFDFQWATFINLKDIILSEKDSVRENFKNIDFTNVWKTN